MNVTIDRPLRRRSDSGARIHGVVGLIEICRSAAGPVFFQSGPAGRLVIDTVQITSSGPWSI